MKPQEGITFEEEVAVLRRCLGAQERDINRLLKRIALQDKALLNRKREVTNYHLLMDWAIQNGRFTKEECGKFIKQKPKEIE